MLGNNGKLFIKAYPGLYSSSNGGLSWVKINTTQVNDSSTIHSMVFNENSMYISATKANINQVIKSVDNGLTFSVASSNTVWDGEYYDFLIDNNYLLATNSSGIFYSKDGGTSFTKTLSSGGGLLKVSNDIFCFTNSGLYTSSDNGLNWTNINNQNWNVMSSTNLSHWNNSIYVSSSYDVMRSIDSGVSFECFNAGIATSNTSYVTATNSTVFYARNNGRVYSSSDGFLNSSNISNYGDRGMMIMHEGVLFSAHTQYVSGSWNKYIDKSLDTGKSWINQVYSLPSGSSSKAMVSNGSTLFACLSTKVVKTSNNGQTWDDCATVSGVLNSLNESNGVLFLGTNSGLFLSNDNGQSWNSANGSSTTVGSATIYDIAFSTNAILIATNVGIFKSIDNCATWQLIFSTSGICFIEAINSKIVIGHTKTLLTFSNDNGATFDFNIDIKGFLNYTYSGIEEVLLAGDNLYVPAGDAGLLTGNVADLFTNTIGVESLNKLLLFPNPSSESIQVNLSAFLGEETKIQVINNEGKVVLNQAMFPTSLVTNIALTDLPKSNYFLRCESKSKSLVRMFVLN